MNPDAHDPPAAPSVGLIGPARPADEKSTVTAAIADYFRLVHDGEEVDRDEFCARYPEHRSELRDTLAVLQFIGKPELFDDLTARPYPLPKEMIAGCQLVRELGRGAFSAVYLADDPEGGRPVVLKLSHLTSCEGRVLGGVKHEHVVPLLWARRDPDSDWYVLCTHFWGVATLADVQRDLYPRPESRPPADAGPLLAAIARRSLPDDPPAWHALGGPTLAGRTLGEAAAAIGGKLASALAYLHGRGIAHGDVKPSNVLLQSGGQPLLVDFNLSPVGERKGVGGTLSYMSPEHLRAFQDKKPLTDDQAFASDVYSLGVVLSELLAGEPPFDVVAEQPGDESTRVLRRRTRRPLCRFNRDVPEPLAGLIARCLLDDPAARPTAAALADALLPAPNPRRRWSLAAVAAVALIAVVGYSAYLTTLPNEVESRREGQSLLAEGRSLMEAGDDEAARRKLRRADKAFQNVAWARSGDLLPQDRFARGQIQLGLANYTEAAHQFRLAHEARPADSPDGLTLAYLSYCLAKDGDYDKALAFGKLAKAAGQRTPAVLTNLAWAALFDKKHAGAARRAVEEARRAVDEAIKLDGRCGPAYFVRATLATRQGADADGLLDLDAAFALLPAEASPQLHVLAAQLHATALNKRPDMPWLESLFHRDRLRAHAVLACERGADPGLLRRSPLLAPWLPPLPRPAPAALGDRNWQPLIEPRDAR